jgi:hypothetical protein
MVWVYTGITPSLMKRELACNELLQSMYLNPNIMYSLS